MGCHMWVFHKIDRSFEEAKSIAINGFRNAIALIEKYPVIDNSGKDVSLFNVNVWKRIISRIENGYIKEAVYRHQDWEIGEHTIYLKGNLYECSNSYHDIFRVHDYPDTILTSYDETINYIESRKQGGDDLSIYLENDTLEDYPATKERLKNIFEKYPETIITFG